MIDYFAIILLVMLFAGCIALKKYLELLAMRRFLQERLNKPKKVKTRRRVKKFNDVDPEEYDESCILSVRPKK